MRFCPQAPPRPCTHQQRIAPGRGLHRLSARRLREAVQHCQLELLLLPLCDQSTVGLELAVGG